MSSFKPLTRWLALAIAIGALSGCAVYATPQPGAYYSSGAYYAAPAPAVGVYYGGGYGGGYGRGYWR